MKRFPFGGLILVAGVAAFFAPIVECQSLLWPELTSISILSVSGDDPLEQAIRRNLQRDTGITLFPESSASPAELEVKRGCDPFYDSREPRSKDFLCSISIFNARRLLWTMPSIELINVAALSDPNQQAHIILAELSREINWKRSGKHHSLATIHSIYAAGLVPQNGAPLNQSETLSRDAGARLALYKRDPSILRGPGQLQGDVYEGFETLFADIKLNVTLWDSDVGLRVIAGTETTEDRIAHAGDRNYSPFPKTRHFVTASLVDPLTGYVVWEQTADDYTTPSPHQGDETVAIRNVMKKLIKDLEKSGHDRRP